VSYLGSYGFNHLAIKGLAGANALACLVSSSAMKKKDTNEEAE
jgi:hypothetical protein